MPSLFLPPANGSQPSDRRQSRSQWGWVIPEERRHRRGMSNIIRDYELVLITVPQLEEEALATLIQRVTGWIAAGNGTVTGTNVWGRRNLAYAIRKLTEGIYVVLNFQLDPSGTRELDRNLRLDEQIIRYLAIRLDED